MVSREQDKMLPEGWMQQIRNQQGGKTQGLLDCYWSYPNNCYRFRNIVDVEGFQRALFIEKGNETLVYKRFITDKSMMKPSTKKYG